MAKEELKPRDAEGIRNARKQNGMFAGLIDLAGSKMPVLQSTVNHYTDLFLKYEDELTEDECDAIDALLRIIEERVVDETQITRRELQGRI